MITLNLVPDSEKKEIRILYFYLGVKNLVFIILSSCLLIASALIFSKIILINYFNDSLTRDVAQTNPLKTSSKDIREFQTQLTDIKKIQSQYLPWSKFFLALNRLVNSGITLNTLMVDQDGKIEITGTAIQRNDLREFEKRLQQSGYFSDFKIPYEVFFEKQDIKFDLHLKADLPKILNSPYAEL